MCSPPTRGWTGVVAAPSPGACVFPAYAGMDRKSDGPRSWPCCVPRLRGDGPLVGDATRVERRCSPPTRGWTGGRDSREQVHQVFPAYAGMDRSFMSSRTITGGVPRLRGDGPAPVTGLTIDDLCSPPTRGWTAASEPSERKHSVFPAYAGMDRGAGCAGRSSSSVPRLRGDGTSSANP